MIPENTPHGSRVNKHKGMMTYALDQDGKLAHIDSVPNGLNCNCHCPACNEPLSARQGKKNEHSFAHFSDSQCAYGYQTSLHLLAKEAISEGCEILLPPVFHDRKLLNLSKLDSEDLESIESPIRGSFTLEKADSVQLEARYGDIIPDIILYYNGKPLIVEIYVTHPVDEEKEDKIRKAGVSAIEFDLSAVDREIDKECLRAIFESGEKCHWVYNSKSAEKTSEFMKGVEKRFEERKKEEQRRREEEEERRQKLIRENGGNFQYYKIYSASLDDGPVPIIYDPPCKKAVSYKDSRCKTVIYCERCPYFMKYEPAQTDFFSPPIERMLCQRQRFDNPNPKPNIATQADIETWIFLFYRKFSDKVSVDPSHNNKIAQKLIAYAEEVAILSGHEELCGPIIDNYCNSLVAKEGKAHLRRVCVNHRRRF